MWVVMTSSASMPSSYKWYAEFRNVAIVRLSQEYTAKDLRPKMISERARGVARLSTMRRAVIHMGKFRVGKTEGCPYTLAVAEAERRAKILNNLAPKAQAGEVMTWGGSA